MKWNEVTPSFLRRSNLLHVIRVSIRARAEQSRVREERELDAQGDKLPPPVLLVDVARALDVQQHEDLHAPVVLLEAGRVPVGPVRLVPHLIVVVLLRVLDRLPLALRQHRARLAPALALALALVRPCARRARAVRADPGPERLELARVLLDRRLERVEVLRVRGRDKIVERLFRVVGLDVALIGELGVERDGEVLVERAGGEAVLRACGIRVSEVRSASRARPNGGRTSMSRPW